MKPSVLNLFGEMCDIPRINQFAVVKLHNTPLVERNIITNIKLTILTLDSSKTIIPRKKPCPQNTKLDRSPNAINQRKLFKEVLISMSQNNTRIIISGYRI